jgi:hypothetical protein
MRKYLKFRNFLEAGSFIGDQICAKHPEKADTLKVKLTQFDRWRISCRASKTFRRQNALRPDLPRRAQALRVRATLWTSSDSS